MAIFYVDGATGSDNNSGAPLTAVGNGTAATRSTNVYTLDGSPDLSSITVNEDTIRIVGETSGQGATGDQFVITAFDDGADTVTVSPTPTGGTSGLTWYIGGPFATINRGMNSISEGDILYVKASQTYTEEVLINYSSSGPGMSVIGYTTTPGDGGKVTVDAESTRTYCVNVFSSVSFYVLFQNFIFQNATNRAVYLGSGDIAMFVNCEMRNCSFSGIFGDNNITLIDCIIDSCGGAGGAMDLDNTTLLSGCTISNCGGAITCNITGQSTIYKCLFYGNTGSSGLYNSSFNLGSVIGNTMVGAGTGQALNGNAQTPYVICDNIFKDYAYGLTTSSANPLANLLLGPNLFDGETSFWNNSTAFDFPYQEDGEVQISGAANFTDEVGDDYTLSDTSDAIDAGVQPVNGVDV